MRFITIVFSLLLFISTSTLAQERNCGTMEHLEYLESQDPGLAPRMKAIQRHTERVVSSPFRTVTGVVTIPVVVHVVYNNNSENISDAQVLSQITILNEDFRRTNADADNAWPQAADSEIEFCMASVDPNGNPTNGITRTPTNVSSFSSFGNPVKFNATGGHNAWPAGDYLNVWVCDLSGGLLGYAQFPGGNPATDGIVVDYAYFGNIGTATPPFELGRTATHEVGHWLNLRHIWGDGPCSVDDFVADTPLSDASNFGCPLNHVSCGSLDMVQNYMDYTNDACMNLFTQGQKTRMRALFEPGGFRESLLNSGACGNSNPPSSCNDGIQNGNETGIDCGGADCPPCPCSGSNIISINIYFDNNPGQTTWQVVDSGGGLAASGGLYTNNSPGSSVTENVCLPDGCYEFTIFDSGNNGLCCFFGFGSFNLTDASGNILTSGARFGSSSSYNFCLATSTANCNDGIQNGNETGVDCGGPDCNPCSSCNDGIQNGNETGVDCGGPDCNPCSSCNDGIQNGNETGVDCGGPDCQPCSSCNDGIQNGNETGVDCGGPDCQPCSSCNDGIQNGNETGVDCGGPDCQPCSSCNDGIQNGNETGIDCGGPDCPPCSSCNDGIQNGNETGIDCGGPDCPPCSSCNDGIQNGNETGIDCGGPDCAPCSSCNDGIQNGNETGVDCGGPDCQPCSSCNNGIQNGNETGVDCGGPDCPPCGPDNCSYSLFNSNDFETNLGIWADGGIDCLWPNRYYSFSNSGIYNVLLRDNTSSSVLTTANLDLSGADEISVDFTYITINFTNSSDDFWLQLSTNGGSTYTQIEEWNFGDEFQNQVREFESVVIPGPFTSNTRLRFRCDAMNDLDFLFLDDVSIQVCTASARVTAEPKNERRAGAVSEVRLFPNPVEGELTVSFNLPEESKVKAIITDMAGSTIHLLQADKEAGRQEVKFNASSMAPGVYFIHLNVKGERISQKFVVIR